MWQQWDKVWEGRSGDPWFEGAHGTWEGTEQYSKTDEVEYGCHKSLAALKKTHHTVLANKPAGKIKWNSKNYSGPPKEGREWKIENKK